MESVAAVSVVVDEAVEIRIEKLKHEKWGDGPTNSVWTELRVEVLTKMWGGGSTAREIVIELSCGLTRSAVIGKAHRLGISRPVDAPNPRLKSKQSAGRGQAAGIRDRRLLHRMNEPAVKPKNGLFLVSDINKSFPTEHRKNIMALKHDSCRFPVGNPGEKGFFFCGDKAELGLPYCARCVTWCVPSVRAA